LSRLPSIQKLDLVSDPDRSNILMTWAEELDEQKEGIESGYIRPWGRSTIASIMRFNRDRMLRLAKLAAHYRSGHAS
jgi:hypothetical protein